MTSDDADDDVVDVTEPCNDNCGAVVVVVVVVVVVGELV